jgi:hypothetical protein
MMLREAVLGVLVLALLVAVVSTDCLNAFEFAHTL